MRISNAFWSMSKLSLQMKCTAFHYCTGTLFNQTHAVCFRMSTSLQCPLCQQAGSVLHIFQGVNIQSSQVSSLNAIILPAGSSWKPSAKALWQVVWSIWMLAAPIVWPNKTFKSLSMLITGQYPAGFLMLVYVLEIDSPLVALMPFCSLAYLLSNSNCQPLLFEENSAPGVTPKTTQQRCTQISRAQCQ